jgi:putative endonuclease
MMRTAAIVPMNVKFARQSAMPVNRNSYQKGITSEQRAATFLRAHGHTILRCRYRNGFGEIDIISIKDSVIHAIEVKERQTIREARFAISKRQQSRISRSLDLFLQSQRIAFEGVQLDAIFVSSGNLCFLENAWYVDDCDTFAGINDKNDHRQAFYG